MLAVIVQADKAASTIWTRGWGELFRCVAQLTPARTSVGSGVVECRLVASKLGLPLLVLGGEDCMSWG